MIRKTLIILLYLLLPSLATTAFAQPRPTPTPLPRPAAPQATPATSAQVPESRIALIDTGVFGDEKAGIYRFVDAVKSLEPEFRVRNQELATMQSRINALAEDIKKLRANPAVDQKSIQAKADEGTRLEQDFNTKKQRLNEDVSRRYQEATTPITEQIGKAMDDFARQRGITMMLDLSKLLPALLTALPAMDVTEAFIADFNRKNPRTGTPARQ